jgi:hypothetical protein
MYTIQILRGGHSKREQVLTALATRLENSKFRATILSLGEASLGLKPVRLRTKKPYCGNHPGECPLGGPPKKNATYLEWEDWVQFHKLVNAVLNRLRVSADVWSTPLDVRGKMWIRKGKAPRIRWDWTEELNRYGRAVRVWNQGTPDQFKTITHSPTLGTEHHANPDQSLSP